MRNRKLLILLLFNIGIASAQIGIGIPNGNPSSILDLSSSNKGFLVPRLTTVQRDAIVSPVAGLNIYNTTKNCMEFYNGTI